MEQKEYEIEQLFLKEFVTKLIIAVKKNRAEKVEEKIESKIDQNETIDWSKEISGLALNETKKELIPEVKTIDLDKKINIMDRKISVIPRSVQSPQVIKTIEVGDVKRKENPFLIKKVEETPKPIQPKPVLQPKPFNRIQASQSKAPVQTNVGNISKINNIVNDPSVISMECPGPGKPILVNKSGITQTAQILLTKEEIESFLTDVSRRTKVPIVQGVFKAAIGNLIITAVVSDFVGSRFLVEKKNPTNTQIPGPPPVA